MSTLYKAKGQDETKIGAVQQLRELCRKHRASLSFVPLDEAVPSGLVSVKCFVNELFVSEGCANSLVGAEEKAAIQAFLTLEPPSLSNEQKTVQSQSHRNQSATVTAEERPCYQNRRFMEVLHNSNLGRLAEWLQNDAKELTISLMLNYTKDDFKRNFGNLKGLMYWNRMTNVWALYNGL